MKTTLMAAAALLGGAANAHRHNHEAFHLKRDQGDLVCHEVVQTITGTDFTWTPTPDAPPANPDSTSTDTLTSTAYSTASLTSVITVPAVVPTPAVQTVTEPGTYTFPATTMTVTNVTSGVVPSTTEVSAGTYTLGGVTTIVETATTVVCPYATVSTLSGGVVTSVIESTTYVCPSAGTYTIAPTTTTVTASTETVTVPAIETYQPGVYTAPAVTTVVETSTVIYCPFASVDATPTPTPSTSSTSSTVVVPTTTSSSSTSEEPAPAPTTTTEEPAPAPTTTTEEPAPAPTTTEEPSTTAEPTTSSSTSTSATPTSTATGGTVGQPWALTYTPYNADTGDCQTAEAVDADLAAVAAAGFTTIRVYSTDCDTLTNAGTSAAKYGLRMIVGIYVGSTAACATDSSDVAAQIEAFQAWAQWDMVDMFVVANEALANGYCTGAQLATLITYVKSQLDYTGPYTTTDVVAQWQNTENAAAVCAVIDFPSANVHSYFTSTVTPAEAGTFVKSQLAIVEEACGGVEGYVLESGYPTAGATIGENVPNAANQQIAIAAIVQEMGDRTVLFSMYDDLWKDPGAYGCEQHWGIVPTVFGSEATAWSELASGLDSY